MAETTGGREVDVAPDRSPGFAGPRQSVDSISDEWKTRYEAAVQAGRLILYDWDLADGHITWGGEVERILGYQTEEMGDVRWAFEQIHPEDRATAEAEAARIATTGTPGTIQYRLRRRDGEYIVVEDCTEFLPSRDGKQPRRLIGFLRDITRQKRAEEELRQLNATLEQCVAERTEEAEARTAQVTELASALTRAEQRERQRLAQVLHDHLQQYMVAARMKLGLLRRHVQDEGSLRLIGELDELLASSIEASRSLTAELNPPVLEHEGLEAALGWLQRWMKDKHALAVDLVVEEQAEPEDKQVRILLFEIIRELLLNVAKHAGVGRAEVRTARPESGWIDLRVADDGKGFDPNVDIHRDDDGGGFGLPSVQRRLELVGGTMEIASAPGCGCRTTIRCPLRWSGNIPSTDRGPGDRAPGAPRKDGSEPVRVLIADSHEVYRQVLGNLLQHQPGIEVVGEAADGRTAVEAIRRLRPEVVLLDMTLPAGEAIREADHGAAEASAVRILPLSMAPEPPVRPAEETDADAAHCLCKDGPWEELVEAIRAGRHAAC